MAEPEARADGWQGFEARFAIGRGQFGVVYLLQHADGRKAVDKRVNMAGLSEKQADLQLEEIRLLRKLRHKYIVGYLDSFETGNAVEGGDRTLHMIMEYCSRGSLAEVIAEHLTTTQPFEARLVRRWLWQLTSALEHVHALRVIHRDLKTDNVFLTDVSADRVDVKLGDFGISRTLSTQTLFAETAVGTPYYLFPELITGCGYDTRTDIWSLGCIAYELCTLSRPFKGDNIGQLALQITRKPPPPLPTSIPLDVHELILHLLSKDKIMRPNASEVLTSAPMNEWAEHAAESDAIDGITSAVESLASGELGAMRDELLATASKQLAARAGGPVVLQGIRRLYLWDTNPESSSTDPAAPTWKLEEALNGHDVLQLCGARTALAALTAGGEAWAWASMPLDEALPYAPRRPAPLRPLQGIKLVQLALGEAQLLALTEFAAGGHVWKWDEEQPMPTRIEALQGVVLVACGAAHCLVATADGDAFSWGRGEDGQLGLGDFEDREEPTKLDVAATVADEPEATAEVSADATAEATAPLLLAHPQVSCRGGSSVLLTQRGVALSCGNDECGVLGHARRVVDGRRGDDGRCELMRPVSLPRTVQSLISVSCGEEHAVALTDDYRVLSWGSKEDGRLGRPNSGRAIGVPEVIESLDDKDVRAVSAGACHSVATTSDGKLFLWGRLGANSCASPCQAQGAFEEAFFLNSCASEWFTAVVAIPPVWE